LNKNIHSGLFEYFIFLIFLIGGVYLLFFKLTFVTIIVLVSYFVSEISHPFERMLVRYGIPNWISGLIVIGLLMGLFIWLLIAAIPPLVNQIIGLEKQLPIFLEGMHDKINDFYAYLGNYFGNNNELQAMTNSTIKSLKDYLTSFALSSITGIIKGVSATIAFFLVPILSYFMITYRQRYKNILRNVILTILGEEYLKVFEDIHSVILGYIVGLIILMLVVSLLGFVGLYIVGIDYALLFGVFGGVMYVIPYVGAIASFIPPIIVAFVVHHSLLMTMEVLAVLLFIHFISGNIIAPFIYSKQLEIDPLAVLLAILFFGKLLGVWGVILSVPLLGIIVISYEKLVPILIKRRGN
jgi:putative permease